MTRNKNRLGAEQFLQQIKRLFEDIFFAFQKYLIVFSIRKEANPIESYDLERSQSSWLRNYVTSLGVGRISEKLNVCEGYLKRCLLKPFPN